MLKVLASALILCLLVIQTNGLPQRPFPQHQRYATGTIRPNHRSQAQQDDDVRAFYDDWKTNYLKAAGATADGQPLYRIAFGSTNPERTVSEGQGYGMVIVALLAGYDADAQAIFDGLWAFSRLHPSATDSRLMGWQVPEGEGNDSAFDGDADIAYGLLLADAQWGSGGKIDYRAAAGEVLSGIGESTVGPESHLPLLGDWVDPQGAQYNQYTIRSSDYMPAHFRAFGRARDSEFWSAVISQTQTVITHLQTHDSPATGLLPDFIVPISASDHTPQPAPANFLEAPTDGSYSYNAGRDPWRIGADALLNGDPTSLAQVRKITLWAQRAAAGDPLQIKPGYTLDGQPIPPGNYFTSFFATPLGVAAMSEPTQQLWLNAIYDAVYARREDYYEDSVTLLCLLIMTGNYWDPTTAD